MSVNVLRRLISTAITALLMTVTAFDFGCAAPEQAHRTERDTPLEVDPTDYIQIAGWWSNGAEQLHMESDGRYQLYDGLQPLHEGRWVRDTHSRIRLEPYTEMNVEPLSVEILNRDEQYLLRVPGYTTFYRIQAPQPPLQLRPPPTEPASNTA